MLRSGCTPPLSIADGKGDRAEVELREALSRIGRAETKCTSIADGCQHESRRHAAPLSKSFTFKVVSSRGWSCGRFRSAVRFWLPGSPLVVGSLYELLALETTSGIIQRNITHGKTLMRSMISLIMSDCLAIVDFGRRFALKGSIATSGQSSSDLLTEGTTT